MLQLTILDYLDYDMQEYRKRPPMKIGDYKISSKFSKTYLLPIFERVKTLKSEEEVRKYFKNRFYLGRGEYAPYAENKQFLVGGRAIKLMLTIDSFSDFIFILNHSGTLSGGRYSIDDLVYPPDMSADKFRSSLTDVDKEKIVADLKRLSRIHSNGESEKHILADYQIN